MTLKKLLLVSQHPDPKRLQRKPRMTITYGQTCIDGLVLSADSLEDDGITKRSVDKLWSYEVQGEWGIAIASAGEADLADTFTDGLRDILGNSDFDEAKLLTKLRVAIRQVRASYPDSQFAFLAAIYGRPKVYARLFRVNDQSLHLGPMRRYQALGMGGSLASFLSSQLFRPTMTVDEGATLAAFILAHVKKHAAGCGGSTSLLTYTKGVDTGFRVWTPDAIRAIEKRFPPRQLREALEKFWKERNPPPRFGSAVHRPEGGSVRWIKTSHLNTKP